MAEPTSALSFYNLILRVAERAGMAYYGSDGQSKALIPVDQYDLDKVKRIVNDGIRLFVASPPATGWKWQSRRASVLLYPAGDGVDNIDTDAARYLLPQHFAGQVDGPIEYASDTNHSTEINWVHPAVIEARRSVSVITAYPQFAAVRPYQPSSPPSLGSSRRWELILDPQPANADTVEFQYTVYFDDMQLEAGTATSGGATTLADSTRLEVDDYFNDWILEIVAGTGIGETATITDYTGATGTFTFTELSGGSTPDNTSVYYVQPASNLHPAGIPFDDGILAACFAETEKQIEQVNEGRVELYYSVHLPNAHRIDGLSAPRKLGNMYRSRMVRERTWSDITTDHDI